MQLSKTKKLISALALIAALNLPPGSAEAVCPPGGMDMIGSVSWESIFPLKVSGITIVPSSLEDTSDPAGSPICICPMAAPPYFRIGVPVAFWEPARLIETVEDPYCFPAIGTQLNNPAPGFLAGGIETQNPDGATPATSIFAQAHYYIFPIWAMLEILTDYGCVEQTSFDVAYITEIDPLWNSDEMALIIMPEAVLFGNPVAQLACIADSLAAAVWLPIDPLFWCMGSWGSAYPMTGHINSSELVEANAGLAARMIYKLGREGLLWDTSLNLCAKTPMPIWRKSTFGLQLAEPVKRTGRIPIGRSGLIWSMAKNPPYMGGDNFVWILFQKRACCAF